MDQQNQQKGRSNGSSDGNGKTRKPNKNRQRARRDFEHNAPLIPISTLFSDFQLTQQNNISIELDPSLLDRVSQPYIDKASDFTVANNIDYEETERDYVASTYALVGMTMVRKLIKSAPGSVKPHLSFFKFIGDSELWAPPALVTVFDNLGKLSQDQFTVRIEYLEQDIVRNALRICKAMSRHSQFSGKYAPIAGTTWENLDVETILYPSNASSRWLKEVGKELLSDTAYNTFPATYQPVDEEGQPQGEPIPIRATFPVLRLATSRTTQITNLITWLETININLPNVWILIAAGLFQIWDPLYFVRSTATMAQVEPRLRDTIVANVTVADVVRYAGFRIVRTNLADAVSTGWTRMIQDIHTFISSYGPTTFNKFLKLTKQPDTEFGTFAQILELDRSAWVRANARTGQDFSFLQQRQDMSGRSLFKISDKGEVASALLFGFSKRVWYHNNQSARLNGSIAANRTAYVATDFLNTA